MTDIEELLKKEVRYAVLRLVEENKELILNMVKEVLTDSKVKEAVEAEINSREIEDSEREECAKMEEERLEREVTGEESWKRTLKKE